MSVVANAATSSSDFTTAAPITRDVTRVRRARTRIQVISLPRPKVLLVASEVHPFARTGGLADVTGSLPQALSDEGCEVAIMVPYHRRFFPHDYPLIKLAEFKPSTEPLGRRWSLNRSYLSSRIPVYLVGQDQFFARDHLYGNGAGDYPDNAERFAFFCRSCLESLKTIGWKPDIIHCHDWQTGLVPLYLRALALVDPFFAGISTLFTVHNLAFTGTFPAEKLGPLGLGEEYFRPDRIEFHGRLSLLKAGLVYADRLNTVSPGYCREIQTAEFGCGLDGLLRYRRDSLSGILNGIDCQLWNPATDDELARNYSAAEPSGKQVNKRALQLAELLPVVPVPLAAIVSRLTDQKGLDLLIQDIEQIMALPLQMVILGEGEPRYVQLLSRLRHRFPDRFRVHPYFEIGAAKRVYAGSDIYLMPSRFEPCGLSELIGMRYGSVPVVRRTGGLADAVKEFDPVHGSGNGFLFHDYSAEALFEAVTRAVSVYHRPREWARVRSNGMSADFSWRRPVRAYLSLYDQLTARSRAKPALVGS